MSVEREIAVRIVRKLREAGHMAYFAGGCVRDQLLGLEPKDFDVATDAPPRMVRQLFPRTQAVGEHFGVILVRLDGVQTEVATFRSDGSYTDGRRPESVAFTNAEHDAQRRDFTINGLFFDPLDDKIIDYVGGQADLQARVLRAIGDPAERFAEDHLRLLRAVRFAARFGLEIEPATWNAIKANADKLKLIAPERVGDEMRRMLVHESRGYAMRILDQANLLPVILRACPPLPFHFNTRGGVVDLERPDLAAALACLLWDVGGLDPDSDFNSWVAGASDTLRLSNYEAEGVLACLKSLCILDGVGVATQRRALGGKHGASVETFLRALRRVHLDDDPQSAEIDAALSWTEHHNAPPRLLTGGDLIAAGWTPGPEFSRVLEAVYDAQLEDRVTTKEEALALAWSHK